MTPEEAVARIESLLQQRIGSPDARLSATDRQVLLRLLEAGHARYEEEAGLRRLSKGETFRRYMGDFARQFDAAVDEVGVQMGLMQTYGGDAEPFIVFGGAQNGLREVLRRLCPCWPFC